MTLVPDLIFNDQDHPQENRPLVGGSECLDPEALFRADNLICFLRPRPPEEGGPQFTKAGNRDVKFDRGSCYQNSENSEEKIDHEI